MEKTYIRPDILVRHKVSGVYRITFDGSWFYIGSSVNVGSRFLQWKTRCENGIFKNCNVKRIFPDVKEIKFEILMRLPPGEIKIEEDRLIKKAWGDPRLLNRSRSAFKAEDIVRTEDQQVFLDEMIKKKGKKIAKFDANGSLLIIFKSKGEAARELKVHHSEIRRAVRHVGMRVKGFLLKEVNPDGTYIENPIPPVKKRVYLKPPKRRSGLKVSPEALANMRKRTAERMASPEYKPPKDAKTIIRYDENMIEVERFPSYMALARRLSVDNRLLKKMLKKGRPGYYKGYFYFPA